MADAFVIETSDLRTTYGGVEALGGLSLQVPAGSIYGFLHVERDLSRDCGRGGMNMLWYKSWLETRWRFLIGP